MFFKHMADPCCFYGSWEHNESLLGIFPHPLKVRSMFNEKPGHNVSCVMQ